MMAGLGVRHARLNRFFTIPCSRRRPVRATIRWGADARSSADCAIHHTVTRQELPISHDRISGWWRRQSIERTLPATFTLLLALLVSFYVFAAFRAVERSAVDAAVERIERVG